MLELNESLLDGRLDDGTFASNSKNRRTRPYIADDALTTAAALSILLCQPLLLSGSPGVGKTGAAYFIASKVLNDKRDPVRFTVTTQTTGRDLLYRFDSLARFRDTESAPLRSFLRFEALGRAIVEACGGQATVRDTATDQPINDPKRIEHITGKPPLAGAFLTVRDLLQPNEPFTNEPRASVVLIDEIDKAPRDTPNDLLESFEAMRFTIEELGVKIGVDFGDAPRRNANPIVVCTTNAENNLPDAFLRRCVFHEIRMPGEKELKKIIAANLHDVALVDEQQAEALADAAYAAGMEISDRIRNVSRPPGTAEFIALARAILTAKIPSQDIARAISAGPKLGEAQARAILGVAVKTAEDLKSALPLFAKPSSVE
jgi:MoxR-like ATPase